MKENRKKEMVGTVVSNRMGKTIVVRVGHPTVHPVFKKTIRVFNKFKAHDQKNEAKIGDTVKIRETRPISKDKRWYLVKVIEKSE